MAHIVEPKKCSEPECGKTYTPHEWGNKKAQREGWFLQMSGESWCPDHNPPWVKEWRNKKRREKYARKSLDADTIQDLAEFEIMTVLSADSTALSHNRNCSFYEYLYDATVDEIVMKCFEHLKECDD